MSEIPSTPPVSWSPAGESSFQLWYERSILAGLFIGAIGFGVHATLFFWAFKLLWNQRQSRRGQFFLVYIVVVFILSNIGNATNLKFGQSVFIDNRDYPGGPGAYFVEQSTNIQAVLCNCVYLVLSWFQDGLLLYRFWIIFGRQWLFIILPSLMFPASFILSCFLIAMLSQPTVTFWTKVSFHLALSFWSISIAFNVIVTFLIAARLLLMRQRSSKLLGYHSSSPYTTVSAMLIESAFIYSSTGLAFLISYGVNSPVQNLFLPLLGQVQSIAPLLIILRVAEGKGWSKDTANAITHTSSLHFASTRTVPAHITSETVLNTMSSRDRMTDNRGPEEQSIVSEFVVASSEQVSKKV